MNVAEDTKVFELPINVDAAGTVSKTLATADTYVDRNIKVTVNTPDAEFKLNKDGGVTATVSTTDTTYTSDTETKYAIEIKAEATAEASQVGVKTAGFAAASDVVDITAKTATPDTKTIYVKEGTITATGEAQALSNTITLHDAGQTEPTADFWFQAASSGSASVTTAGWVAPGDPIKGDGNAYYTIDKVQMHNEAALGKTYEDIDATAPVLISGGYLYIDEGYIKNSKISLSHLVPDGSNVKGKAEWIYQGYSAYDNDGNLVAGTMGNAVLADIAANDAKATISTVTVAPEGSGFKVTGSQAITGTATASVESAGYLAADVTKQGSVSGTADVSATLGKVGVGADLSKSDATVTPVISKETSTAKSGEITTTAPTAGKYIAVSTAAIADSVTVSPKVTSEGYGTATVFDKTDATVTAGANASGTYYVPLTAGSHTAESDTPTITKATATVAQTQTASSGFEGNLNAGFLSTQPTEGVYITLGADKSATTAGKVVGNVNCTSTEGYIEASTETKTVSGDVEVEVTAAANKYLRVYDGTIVE